MPKGRPTASPSALSADSTRSSTPIGRLPPIASTLRCCSPAASAASARRTTSSTERSPRITMPTDPTRLRKLIAARRFEDVGRRLREASAADLAAIPTPALLEYLESLPEAPPRTIPEGLLEDLRRRRPTEADLAIKVARRMILAGLAEDARLVIDGALEAAEQKASLALKWIVSLLGLGIPAEARAQLATVSARYLGPLSVEHAAAQIDLEEQKFDAAVARLEPIVRRHPELTSFQATIDRARTCSSIVARFATARQAPRRPPDYAVFAVNLDEQAERF